MAIIHLSFSASYMDSTLRGLIVSLEATKIPRLIFMAQDLKRVASDELHTAGDKYPTVELSDVSMTDDGAVKQDWTVRYKGKESDVHTLTGSDGDISVMNDGNSMDIWGRNDDGNWSPVTSADEAVLFILKKAHPRYYPERGQYTVMDDAFINELERSRPIGK